MSDVWGSFERGLRIGGALRREKEQRQREQQYGEAFQLGGWDSVASTAGGMGDFETANTAQGYANDQQQNRTQQAQRHFTVLGNIATSLLGVPYEQRRPRIQQMVPLLTQMGLDTQAILAYDPTDEALQNVRALQGQYSQFTDIRNQGDDIVGVRPDGSVQVLRQGQRSAGRRDPGAGYQWTDDSQTALEPIPGGPRDPNSPTRPGRTFGPDQRARVAITLDSALEAAQTLERLEAQAQARQGTHVSSTPYGQDWGARVAELVPFDDGAVARLVGGSDYNAYNSASSAFEAAMLPILSGAAVTESEASRVIRAVLPQLNDSPEVLAQKRRRRHQMLNGAAQIGGRPLPYPDEAVDTQFAEQAAAPAAGDIGIENMTEEQLLQLLDQLENGG